MEFTCTLSRVVGIRNEDGDTAFSLPSIFFTPPFLVGPELMCPRAYPGLAPRVGVSPRLFHGGKKRAKWAPTGRAPTEMVCPRTGSRADIGANCS